MRGDRRGHVSTGDTIRPDAGGARDNPAEHRSGILQKVYQTPKPLLFANIPANGRHRRSRGVSFCDSAITEQREIARLTRPSEVLRVEASGEKNPRRSP